MNKNRLKSYYKQELKRAVEALKAYRPEKIILFGSMLDPSKISNDIDLFLIRKTKIPRLGRRVMEARAFLPDQRVPIDMIIYTPEEIDTEINRGNVFISEILEKGKVLYEQEN